MQTKRWLAEYRVASDLTMQEVHGTIFYSHPNGTFEVQIQDAPTGGVEGETLAFHVIFYADDLQKAEEVGQALLNEFLHLLTFATSTRFRLSRKVHLTDWTKGTEDRHQLIYATHNMDDTQPLLTPDLMDTLRLLHSSEASPALNVALRWFSAAVRSTYMEDQFQYFWFVIELLGNARQNTEKVTDKCQRCGSDLHCDNCGPSKHRPFGKQKIEMLLADMDLHPTLIKALFYIRNQLMHGEPREEIEARIMSEQPDFTFEQAVNRIADTAWMVILNSFQFPAGRHQPKFLEVEGFVDHRMTVKAHLVVRVGRDPDNPKIEDIRLAELSLVEGRGSEERIIGQAGMT